MAGDVCALLTIETMWALYVCTKSGKKAEGAAFRRCCLFSPRANTKESPASTPTFVVSKACCHYREGKGLEVAVYITHATHSHGRCSCILLEYLPFTLFVQ